MDKVRYLIGIVFCLLMMGVGTVKAEDINVSQQQENVDAKDIVFGHIQDSYEWHITKWGDKDIVIPLPVIVYSKETGGIPFFLPVSHMKAVSTKGCASLPMETIKERL